MRCSLIRNSKTSEARVSASYSSEVVGCREGIWERGRVPSPGKKNLYNGSVIRVNASYSSDLQHDLNRLKLQLASVKAITSEALTDTKFYYQ